MYNRLLISQLMEWKNAFQHKPLVIRGARQVGKSTLVREFGKEFDLVVEVNLELSEDAEVFQLRGTLRMNRGDKMGALDDMRKVLDLNPELLQQLSGEFKTKEKGHC